MINPRTVEKKDSLRMAIAEEIAVPYIYNQVLINCIIALILSRAKKSDHNEILSESMLQLFSNTENSTEVMKNVNSVLESLENLELHEEPFLSINKAIDSEIRDMISIGHENFSEPREILTCVRNVSFNRHVCDEWKRFCKSCKKSADDEKDESSGNTPKYRILTTLIGVYLYVMEGVQIFFSTGA